MPNSDKNILITPNRNLSGLPEISVTGFGNSTVSIRVPDGNTASLSFETNSQRIFSIDSQISSGTLFSAVDNFDTQNINVRAEGSIEVSSQKFISVTDEGLVLPSYTYDAMPPVEEGLLVYDKSAKVPKIYTNNRWVQLSRLDPIRTGLLCSYDFSNPYVYPGLNNTVGSGTVWDESPNGYHGALTNGPVWFSQVGGCFAFDGFNDYIQITPSGDTFAWTPSGSGNQFLSLEIWFQSTQDPDGGIIVTKPWNGNGEYNLLWGTGSISWSSGGAGASAGFADMVTGRWEHAVAVINPTQYAVYRNGINATGFLNHNLTGNSPTFGNSQLPMAVMTLYPYGSGSWSYTGHAVKGKVGLFRAYNRQLSAAEIAQNYHVTRERFGA